MSHNYDAVRLYNWPAVYYRYVVFSQIVTCLFSFIFLSSHLPFCSYILVYYCVYDHGRLQLDGLFVSLAACFLQINKLNWIDGESTRVSQHIRHRICQSSSSLQCHRWISIALPTFRSVLQLVYLKTSLSRDCDSLRLPPSTCPHKPRRIVFYWRSWRHAYFVDFRCLRLNSTLTALQAYSLQSPISPCDSSLIRIQ